MKVAEEVLGLSSGTIYRLEGSGQLRLIRLAGRVLVDTASVLAFLETAEKWTSSGRGDAGRQKRSELAAARW